ncbi:Hypothetical protein NTJ_01369 [Nesidiocoris tenuis]|uniref:Uncharacterized protein n=1 Tax=Nesidiocoris tenuis TaxID=355587 RepID=A0ABN7A9A5_9HEMI|nr:Hypothetical protein NTJ_01369 [Nesidiocoris tenuis]
MQNKLQLSSTNKTFHHVTTDSPSRKTCQNLCENGTYIILLNDTRKRCVFVENEKWKMLKASFHSGARFLCRPFSTQITIRFTIEYDETPRSRVDV